MSRKVIDDGILTGSIQKSCRHEGATLLTSEIFDLLQVGIQIALGGHINLVAKFT